MKKQLFILLINILFISASFAQVAINTDGSEPDGAAMLDIKSTEKGILIPRMTSAERNAIGLSTSGLLVYDLDTESFWYYNNATTQWVEIGSGGAAAINDLTDGISDVSNLFLGNNSGTQDDGDQKNTGLGINSLYWNESGDRNTSLGYKTAYRNNTGSSNVAIGSEALYFNTSKSHLVAVGDSALYWNGNNASQSSHGTDNTAIGSKSLANNTTGYANSAAGSRSMYRNTTGNRNTAFGYKALEENKSGNFNLISGAYASGLNESGSYNVSLGYGADYYNNGGSNNVVIGYSAGRGSSGNNKSGNIFIGHKAGYSESGSNKLYIHNSESTTPLIYGDFSSLKLGLNAQTGIGTSNPIGNFQVHDPDSHHNIMYLTPMSNTGDSTSIFFAEDNDAGNGMYWMYDGYQNHMELHGKTGYGSYGPHILIKRNSGDIAIGGENFATGYKLSVEGKVICEEVRVSLQEDWPDYVFGGNYHLPTIAELEKHINEKGHLPNIPAAEEIQSSGIELGEMQRLMMEKIEELSLYIIRQDKRISELEEKLAKNESK